MHFASKAADMIIESGNAGVTFERTDVYDTAAAA